MGHPQRHCSVDCSRVGAWYLDYWAATPAVHAYIFFISLTLDQLWSSTRGLLWSLQPLHSSWVLLFNLCSRQFTSCLCFACSLSHFIYRVCFCTYLSVWDWYWFFFFYNSSRFLHVLLSAFTKFWKVFSAVCEILIILLGNCVFGDKPAAPLCCRCTAVEILIFQAAVSLPPARTHARTRAHTHTHTPVFGQFCSCLLVLQKLFFYSSIYCAS